MIAFKMPQWLLLQFKKRVVYSLTIQVVIIQSNY
jgi:hypothetical protein